MTEETQIPETQEDSDHEDAETSLAKKKSTGGFGPRKCPATGRRKFDRAEYAARQAEYEADLAQVD